MKLRGINVPLIELRDMDVKNNNSISLWSTIIRILSAILDFVFARSRAKKIQKRENQELFKEVYNDLKNQFETIDANKEEKQKEASNVQELSDRLNNRF